MHLTKTLQKKKPHISWLIAALGLGLVGGIISVNYVTVVSTPAIVAAAAACLIVGSATNKAIAAVLAVLLLGLTAGYWRGSSVQAEEAIYQAVLGTSQQVSGRIYRDPVVGPNGDIRFSLDQIKIAEQAYPGKIWISTKTDQLLLRGDIVMAEGLLVDGFGVYTAVMFRASIVAAAEPIPGDIARKARDNFSGRINAVMSDTSASLGLSFLFGQKNAMSRDDQEVFRTLGLIHLVVASGFHLSIIIRFVRRVFMRVSKYTATIFSFAAIAGMLMISGYSTSMVRAGYVSGLSLLAWYVGRSIHPVVILLAVAGLTAMISPSYVWSDVGWYLSFAAFAGVIIVAPLIMAYFWGADRQPNMLIYIVVATTAAQLTTLPIIASAFGQFSPLALIANILILPVVPIAMLLTFLVGVFSYGLPYISSLLSVLAEIPLRYIQLVTEFLADTQWAQGELQMTGIQIAVYYAILLGICGYFWRATGLRLREQNPIE